MRQFFSSFFVATMHAFLHHANIMLSHEFDSNETTSMSFVFCCCCSFFSSLNQFYMNTSLLSHHSACKVLICIFNANNILAWMHDVALDALDALLFPICATFMRQQCKSKNNDEDAYCLQIILLILMRYMYIECIIYERTRERDISWKRVKPHLNP